MLKSIKHVCSVLSLRGEEAASNVIKLALILENGWLSGLSLMGCVFEFGIWIKCLARTLTKAAPTKHGNEKDKHKVIKTGCKLEKRVLRGFGDKEHCEKYV